MYRYYINDKEYLSRYSSMTPEKREKKFLTADIEQEAIEDFISDFGTLVVSYMHNCFYMYDGHLLIKGELRSSINFALSINNDVFDGAAELVRTSSSKRVTSDIAMFRVADGDKDLGTVIRIDIGVKCNCVSLWLIAYKNEDGGYVERYEGSNVQQNFGYDAFD